MRTNQVQLSNEQRIHAFKMAFHFAGDYLALPSVEAYAVSAPTAPAISPATAAAA